MKRHLIMLALAGALAHVSLAANAEPLPRTVSVTGYAESKVAPDKATVYVNVYSEDKALDTAKAVQDKKVKQLLALAAKQGVKNEDISTNFANVQPRYRYEEKTRKRILEGYTLTNNVEVTLRDLDKVGPFMDSLISAGFDQINNVQFGLEKRRQHEEKLMSEALKNAKQKASEMASVLGSSIGQPISISESGARVMPPMPMARGMVMAMDAAESSKSISTYSPEGVIEIQQTVNVIFALE